jgi:hypothetical protein
MSEETEKSVYIQTDFIFKAQLLLYIPPTLISQILHPVQTVYFWILYDS